MSLPESYDAFVRELASLLEVEPGDLSADDSLLDFGLDSIRLMTLVERLRSDGLEVSFEQLAEEPSLRGLSRHLGLSP